MKNQVTYVSTRQTSPGHWRVTIEINGNETYRCTTTNSRAVDGHDGGKIALAKECICANSYDCDLFDFYLIEEN